MSTNPSPFIDARRKGTEIGCFLAWIAAILNTAVNDKLTKSRKVMWVTAEMFIYPTAALYMIFVETREALKIIGIFMLAAPIFAVGLQLWHDNRGFLASIKH
jgi:hypothetical protein